MLAVKNYKFWFCTGSQDLYGDECLANVAAHSKEIVAKLNESGKLPFEVVWKPTLITNELIRKTFNEANTDDECAGVIVWCHTFSPAKSWILGLKELRKPLLHLHTQYNEEIPYDSIDMDFMNLNQSAHGDREHGYIHARMRKKVKVIAGYWKDEQFQNKMGIWMRAAIGASESRKLRVLRISDNMRNVAVTDGDKIEAQIKLGWQVDHYGVGDIIKYVNAVTDDEIDAQMQVYKNNYEFDTDNIDSVRYQAREEVAIKKFLDENGFGAFHTNFEDLQELRQLPGLAAQDLMRQGYGFGAEGDWKVAAMTRIMKLMAEGMIGGTAFMEDYTYHFEPGNEMLLGSHMLEVCPTIAANKPKIQVHPLGIGDREDPARLDFKAQTGNAIVVTLVDMGDRLRKIVNDVECKEQVNDMPKLPVARVMWKLKPDFATGSAAWIYAGGAHHAVVSTALTADDIRLFAKMTGTELVVINDKTELNAFEQQLEMLDTMASFRR